MVGDPVEIIIAIVIMALVSRGIAFVLSDGQIFGFAGKWHNSIRTSKPNLHFATKPLGFCGNCSVWLWGTLAIIAFGMMPALQWHHILIVTPYVIRYVEIPSLLWLLPLYWLGATGLQDLLDP